MEKNTIKTKLKEKQKQLRLDPVDLYSTKVKEIRQTCKTSSGNRKI